MLSCCGAGNHNVINGPKISTFDFGRLFLKTTSYTFLEQSHIRYNLSVELTISLKTNDEIT